VADTVVLTTPVIQTLTSATQGPSGPQGPQGSNGLNGLNGLNGSLDIITLTAGTDLGGNRVVTGAVEYADNTNLDTLTKAIGVTAGAAILGEPIHVISGGELEGFFGLTPNQPVYLSVNGTVTQTLPVTGYIQRIGVAVTSTKIIINLSEPLAL
jgi:hypothetical protein